MTIAPFISERLLQFIWQFQYFNKTNLVTIDEKELHIIHPGNLNTNAGPDFIEAKIKIDNTVWAGNVELHIKSSGWYAHRHSSDPNYSNIILHVVWLFDKEVKYANGQTIATLELQPLVSKLMLEQYGKLMDAQGFVPCQDYLPVLSQLNWEAWKETLLAGRLERKSKLVLEYLHQSGQHWEETFWWLLARNFGIKVNADIFEQAAISISVNILAKHKNQIHQLEALLLGQCGLLNEDFYEDYPQLLKKEYHFLQKKYKLVPVAKPPVFLRMRPANFPAIRLAQLAMIISQSTHLFSKIKDLKDVEAVKKLFDITANDYWHYHYRFDEATPHRPKKIGSQMTENIIVNTIVPVLFAYGIHRNENTYKEKAIAWLSQLSPEQNTITKQWKAKGINNASAFDSQALIELKNNFCSFRHCLDCAVGNKLLKAPPNQSSGV